MNERLQRLINLRGKAAEELEKLTASRKAITDLVRDSGREELSAEEDTEYREKTQEIAKKQTEIKGFDERIKELSDEEARAGDLDEGAKNVRKAQQLLTDVKEPVTYSAENARGMNARSYFQDLMRYQLGMDADGKAQERLRRHAIDVETDKQYRDLDRVDGNGGYFTPPVWLVKDYIALARAGRPYANVVQNLPLPSGISSLQIPKISSGTAVGIQTADNAPVTEVDLDDTFIEAKVRTVAGQQDVAIQSLEQSPINFDEVIFQDLYADYAVKVDLQVLQGSGSNGQVVGVHSTPGIESIAIDTLSVAAFYAAVADGIQRVYTLRHQAPTHIAVHPRRWAWLNAQLDDNNRPLVAPSAQAPQNAIASFGSITPEGIVGSMQGLPVLADASIGTAYGTGHNEDVVYVQRSSDMLLYESGIRSRVLNEVGSGNLTVRLQVFGYILFTAERYPKSIVEIGGLPAPEFV